MKSEKLTQRNVQDTNDNDSRKKSSDCPSKLKHVSQHNTSKQKRFSSIITKVAYSACQGRKPWGPLLVRYMWYALNIGFLVIVYGFPYLSTIRITLRGKEHREFLDYALKLLEAAAPGSSTKLASMIPYNWTPGVTHYDYYFQGMCRIEEGKEQVCQRRNAQRYLAGLIENIGAQIAEHMNDPSLSSKWSKTFQSALRTAIFRIKPETELAAVKFLEKVNVKTGSTDLTALPVLFFVLSIVDAICDHTDPSLAVALRVMMVPLSLMCGIIYILSEKDRKDQVPAESFGRTHTRGPYFRFVVWFCALKIVYYVASFWYDNALLDDVPKHNNRPHPAEPTRKRKPRNHCLETKSQKVPARR